MIKREIINDKKKIIMEDKKWDELLQRMEAEAMKELLHYYEKTGKQQIKDTVKKVAGRYVPPKDYVFWPTGLLAEALMGGAGEGMVAGKIPGKAEALKAVKEYFDRWISAGMPIYYVDDVLSGVALLNLYKVTGEEKYRNGADKMAQYLFRLAETEADGAGSIPYRPAQKNQHIYVDGVGMMGAFLARYGRVCGSRQAMELAFIQIENMLKFGMDEKTGLPYHGFQYENGVKYGIIGWGRAVGWLLMGMTELLNSGEDMLRKEEEAYQAGNERMVRLGNLHGQLMNLVTVIEKYQKDNGAFAWQLEALEGPEDSSATAMIADALLRRISSSEKKKTENHEVENNKEEYAKLYSIAERATDYLATCEKDGKIYCGSGECMGFSQYPQVYGAYPWTLGPALSVLRQVSAQENQSYKK